ncbi:hypothetical protein GCM10011273_18030 [Asticcacaulis endophyticus]|uniref:CN hydrolase domain-containing protein n=1 Tax=Asticcacaulis endophyticus TaxID=1395890 RepID=A0A918UTM4_9CAUL|nr:hypothetical protein GCM10011273_18030 [Asticcacaulis endophyticus]
MPAKVDGSDVKPIRIDSLELADRDMRFGAALFPALTVIKDETHDSFIITGVNCSEMKGVVGEALKQSFMSGCIATMFPELTIDLNTRCEIETLLIRKPWLYGEDGERAEVVNGLPRTPAMIVAGSWHEAVGEAYQNVATIYGGNGKPLVRYTKRSIFSDENDRSERIECGGEFVLLVLDDALIAFGICLDFCNLEQPSPYAELSADLILVPSFGNRTTMAGHINNAQQVLIRQKSRTFVVQQMDKLEGDFLGYVLPPALKIQDNADLLRVGSPWNLITV